MPSADPWRPSSATAIKSKTSQVTVIPYRILTSESIDLHGTEEQQYQGSQQHRGCPFFTNEDQIDGIFGMPNRQSQKVSGLLGNTREDIRIA